MTNQEEDGKHHRHGCIKGYITRTFVAVIIVNLGISIMSSKANGFCHCPKKCNKNEDCKKRCRKNCCKWFLHMLFLVVSYIIAATVFASVVGATAVTTVTAASDGLCKSGFTNLTDIANTVLVAFKNWMCQLAAEHELHYSSSSSSEEWAHGHHHGHHHWNAERMCKDLPNAFTDQQVDAWCDAADMLWHPMLVLVWIGACLAIAQFTMAMLQRANLVAFNKKVEGERKEYWAAWKSKHCQATDAQVSVFSEPEKTTPGGEVTQAIKV